MTVAGERCPECRLSWSMFPPVRVDECVEINGFKRFRPGDFMRCVECKSLHFLPRSDAAAEGKDG